MSRVVGESAAAVSDKASRRWTALAVLTAINLLNYIDRYIFSALAPGLQRDLGFNDTQLGVLGSGFIIAYIVVAPLFGWWGDRRARPKVMSFGVGLWSIATAFSGLTSTFVGQLVARISVGVGESAYSVIAPATIADFFSLRLRGRVFAIYSGAIPIGSALGYILGEQLGKHFGWQKAFFFVGTPGLICALVLFFVRDSKTAEVANRPLPSRAENRGPWAHFFSDAAWLAGNGGFIAIVLGYAAYTFVVGGMAFWMPLYIDRYFHVNNGITVFGAVTVAGGFVGTFLGGWWADRIERRAGNGFLKVSIFSIAAAVPLFAMTLAMGNFTSFAVTLFLMEIALFLCISPLDAAVVGIVRPEMRSTAMALNIFLMHFLGDGISRILIGSLSDSSGLKAAISFFPYVLIIAGVIWFVGFLYFWQPLAWPVGATDVPPMQAHRGLWKPSGLQENTIAAFRAARAAGAQMVELDVQLSADGKVVVFHDANLLRLRNLDIEVAKASAPELARLADIPLLQDVLADSLVPPSINVELKTGKIRGGSLERAVADAIVRTGSEKRVLISSFNPFALRRMAKLLPNVPRALLVSETRGHGNRLWFRKMWLGALAQPHLLHLQDEMVNEMRLHRWVERGFPVAVWTVNDPARARQLLHWGARSVITDSCTELCES